MKIVDFSLEMIKGHQIFFDPRIEKLIIVGS
jgi:hypothetical protein